jgi:hypothetical protein
LSNVICLDPGNMRYVVMAMEDRLLAHPELGLYKRGGRIVRIERDHFIRPDETETTALVIDEVERAELLLDVASVAEFERTNKRGQMAPADPTILQMGTLMGLKLRLRLPRLTGVIEAPLLLPNGRMIEAPGYDDRTGLFLDTGGVNFPPINERPTKEECLEALKRLDEDLLVNFPFVDDASRSVALSALLTGVSRAALKLAPMHAYSAPEAGTGKSYLADLVVLLATGRLAAAINAGPDEEETEKRIDGLLLKSINHVIARPRQAPVSQACATKQHRQRAPLKLAPRLGKNHRSLPKFLCKNQHVRLRGCEITGGQDGLRNAKPVENVGAANCGACRSA